jgi:ABC-type amino acid transport system permease subunit
MALVLQQMHADGSLQLLAQKHGVDSPFLKAQQALWSSSICSKAGAETDARCVLPPRDAQLAPTEFAGSVERIEKLFRDLFGIKLTLAMLKSKVALGLFIEGIAFSLVLVSGAVAATVGFSLIFGAALSAQRAWLRWPMRFLLWTMQSTPLILLMILAGVLLSAMGSNSPWASLVAAVLVLGIFNGSNAGQAIAEAMASLQMEFPNASAPQSAAIRRASGQLVAFVVNATRGSPAASVIGVPELLSALTDVASFSSERVTTYTLLLIFYMAVVAIVVRLGHAWQARLGDRETWPASQIAREASRV